MIYYATAAVFTIFFFGDYDAFPRYMTAIDLPRWSQHCPANDMCRNVRKIEIANELQLPPKQSQLPHANENEQRRDKDDGLPPLFPLVLLIIGAGSFYFFYWVSGR